MKLYGRNYSSRSGKKLSGIQDAEGLRNLINQKYMLFIVNLYNQNI